MNQEKQQIALATMCGWTDIKVCTRADLMDSYGPMGESNIDGCVGSLIGMHPTEKDWYPLPDYARDLNAISAAEWHLSQQQRDTYIGHLKRMGISSYGAHTANAAQRAAGILRTVGLWVDDDIDNNNTEIKYE